MDSEELERRRLTAAAYGFESWDEFRDWRKRDPAVYRARSRQLLEPSPPSGEAAIVVDLFDRARELRGDSASAGELRR